MINDTIKYIGGLLKLCLVKLSNVSIREKLSYRIVKKEWLTSEIKKSWTWKDVIIILNACYITRINV